MDRIHSYTFTLAQQGKKPNSDKDACPLCKKQRIEEKAAQRKCKCGPDVYLVYAFKFDKIGSKNNSQQGQRGGPARLLGSACWQKGQNKASETDKFGVLMVTTSHIYFFEETPGYWQDHVLEKGKLNTDHNLRTILQDDRSSDSGSDQKLDKFIGGMKGSDDVLSIELRKLQGMTIVQKKVPYLEFKYSQKKGGNKAPQYLKVSMMSDFNIQETLYRVKDLKQKASSANDEDAE